MTRFARAKGSKASNERVPEEPTPWHVLKQQLESATLNEKEQKRIKKSAKELLNEKEESLYYPTLENTNTDWAEFEDVIRTKKHKDDSSEDAFPKKKIKKHKAVVDIKKDESIEKCNNVSETPKNNNQDKINMKKKNRAEKRKRKNSKDENNVNNSNDMNTVSWHQNEKSSGKLSKRQKRNMKNKNKINNKEQESSQYNKEVSNETEGMFNTEGNDWRTNLKFGKSDKSSGENKVKDNTNDKKSVPTDKVHDRKPFDQNHSNSLRTNNFKPNDNNKFYNNTKTIKKRKPPKIRDDKEHKRRKPDPGATKVIINGLEIEIVLYDGFPVKKEDADRLKELKEKMVMNGISKSDIDAAMKLERRKAEKALTRVKKNVCFHCRKAGHVLSDCPELGREEAATGICFKCGSTEHTHFECRVNKKEEFRYAMCFICREQGHIAKQCPDNPKGLYPQGGACKICGDVTHLKKDCPDLAKGKEDNTLTLNTIGDNAIESLDGAEEIKKLENTSKIKNKVVKF